MIDITHVLTGKFYTKSVSLPFSARVLLNIIRINLKGITREIGYALAN